MFKFIEQYCRTVYRTFSMEEALGQNLKYLKTVFQRWTEWRSYGLETTWGWVINDIIFIFGGTNPLMFPNEMKHNEMKRKWLWSFGGVGLDLLHLCFYHRSESDQGVVFDTNETFSTFCLKCCLSVWNLPTFKCW